MLELNLTQILPVQFVIILFSLLTSKQKNFFFLLPSYLSKNLSFVYSRLLPLIQYLHSPFTAQWWTFQPGCPLLHFTMSFSPCVLPCSLFSLFFFPSFHLPLLPLISLLPLLFHFLFFVVWRQLCPVDLAGLGILSSRGPSISASWVEFVFVPCDRNWLNWPGRALIPGSSNLPAAACFASLFCFLKHSVLAEWLRGSGHLLPILTIWAGSLETTRRKEKNQLKLKSCLSTQQCFQGLTWCETVWSPLSII